MDYANVSELRAIAKKHSIPTYILEDGKKREMTKDELEESLRKAKMDIDRLQSMLQVIYRKYEKIVNTEHDKWESKYAAREKNYETELAASKGMTKDAITAIKKSFKEDKTQIVKDAKEVLTKLKKESKALSTTERKKALEKFQKDPSIKSLSTDDVILKFEEVINLANEFTRRRTKKNIKL